MVSLCVGFVVMTPGCPLLSVHLQLGWVFLCNFDHFLLQSLCVTAVKWTFALHWKVV
jgi:hypothetical protein